MVSEMQFRITDCINTAQHLWMILLIVYSVMSQVYVLTNLNREVRILFSVILEGCIQFRLRVYQCTTS